MLKATICHYALTDLVMLIKPSEHHQYKLLAYMPTSKKIKMMKLDWVPNSVSAKVLANFPAFLCSPCWSSLCVLPSAVTSIPFLRSRTPLLATKTQSFSLCHLQPGDHPGEISSAIWSAHVCSCRRGASPSQILARRLPLACHGYTSRTWPARSNDGRRSPIGYRWSLTPRRRSP